MKLKKVKNIVATSVLLSALTIGPNVFADDHEVVAEPGTTPDSFLYGIDLFLEDMQIAFSFNSETDAELLLQFAQERLSEAKLMTEEEKLEFVKESMDDFLEKIENAQELIAEIVVDENVDEEIKDSLLNELDEATEIDEEEIDLSEEDQVLLEEKKDEASTVANVVKGIDQEVVKSLREQDLGYGEVAKIVALSEVTGKSIEEITNSFKEGKGFGEIARENGLHPSVISTNFKERRIQEKMEKAVEAGDEKEVQKLEEKLKKLQVKKEKVNKEKRETDELTNEITKIEDELNEEMKEIEEELTSGEITEEEANVRIAELKAEAQEELEEKEKEVNEKEEERAEKESKKVREQAEKQREKEEEHAEKEREEAEERAEKQREEEEERVEKEREEAEERVEKQREEEEERAEKEREEAEESAEKEREEAEESAKKRQDDNEDE